MHIISKQGSADNVLTYEHICDTAADMAAIERRYITLGSVCIVLQGESGAMEVYMADSDKEWHDVIVTGGGSGESAPAGLSLYICTSSEVANGKPDVEAPTEGVLYLVPSGNESGNLYDEYVYVNDAWELFGGASIDLTGYVTTQEMNSALAAKANSADIPAWAKAAQKPTYTAQEVGALPANTTIPTAVSDLTNDSGFVSPASQPTEDGTALVYVNGAWKAQPGYGYGDATRSSLFSFTAADFTGNARTGEYETTINLSEVTQDLTEEEQAEFWLKISDIFFYHKEFEVKINNIVYNSIHDKFEYRLDSEFGGYDISLRDSNDYYIFTLKASENEVFFCEYGGIEPTPAEIITLSKNYTPISKDLFPDMPVKESMGEYSAAEGQDTIAIGVASHAEGIETQAIGNHSHAEGQRSKAEEVNSHAEGCDTIAEGDASHAEGENTIASGEASHAEGDDTAASSYCSHSEGQGTISAVKHQHVQGKYNVADTPDNNDEGIYADIIGNGTVNNRSNAYALTWTGDGHYAGDVYVHSNSDSTGGNKLATEAYVTNAISASTQTVSGATPTVTATANTTYVCGTVSTLSFTPAVSGISDILFTSGSTATVLTVPNTVKFPEWFDPSNLSANTTYEISVMNGTYGAVMAWATT